MRAAGLRVMEVWHRGEPLRELVAIARRRQPGEVVGIGGLVGVNPTELRRICDGVFATLRDTFGWAALPPVHGLGVSNETLARRYPWWSVDSSTYTVPRRYGQRFTRAGRQTWGHANLPRGVPAAADLETRRVFTRWERIERDMTAAWQRRGVTFAP